MATKLYWIILIICFKRNDRIGIIGKNGTGKSTFLNILTENDTIDAGKIVWGETLKFGYYTQSRNYSKRRTKSY